MDKICRTCLNSERRIEEVIGPIRVVFLTLIPDYNKSDNILLCWECKILLHHVHMFRKRTRESQKYLNNYFVSSTTDDEMVSKSCLVISKIEVHSYPTMDNLSGLVNSYTSHVKEVTQNNVVKDENKPIDSTEKNKNSRVKSIQIKRLKKETNNRQDPFKCKICGEIFKTRGKYEYHKEVHGAKPECKECEQTFVNKSSLWKHKNLIHNNTKTYSCQICKKRFFTEAGYQSHSTNHIESSNQYFCRPCEKFFKTNSSFRKHQRSSKKHVNPETWNYNCSQCNRKFSSEAILKQHYNIIHLNTKRFICKQCPRQYCTTRALRIHVKLKHENLSQPKDKVCELCGKVFKTSQVLKSHIRTHTGERPYVCSLCQARFTQSGALRTHTRLVHLRNK